MGHIMEEHAGTQRNLMNRYPERKGPARKGSKANSKANAKRYKRRAR